MSKAPKHPSKGEDLKRWDDEGGAPRSGHHPGEPSPSSQRQAEPALYYFNVRTPGGVIEDPEGNTCAGLQGARDRALSDARSQIAEGDLKGEDRRGWRFEIMDRANKPVLTVAFLEALGPNGG